MFPSRASLAIFAGLTAAGVMLAGFAACVGDSNTPTPGTLGGPCLANGECSQGLQCNGATSTCVVADAGTKNDASANDANVTDAADEGEAGPRQCSFQPTTFPCTQEQAPACYGAAQSCSLTGCGGGDTDYKWVCFGPNQCGNTPCCLPGTAATLSPTVDCSTGGLQMTYVDGGVFGGIPASVCGSGTSCPVGNIQLCQFNTQCPEGTVCSPVKISGDGVAANKVIIGACVPE